MTKSTPLKATRKPVRHPTRTPCRAVFGDDDSQGNKPELSYEALEKALIELELKGMELKRAHQLQQAKLAQSEAIIQKAKRLIAKGARRSKEATSSARLLQTKLERMKQETDVPHLHETIEEKLEDFQSADEEARKFKELFLSTKDEEEEEAYQRRKAMAATVAAHRKAKELELQRQMDLDWFQKSNNRANVNVFFLLQLCLKALPLRPYTTLTSTHEAQQDAPQEKPRTRPKAAIHQKKQQPRF